MPPDPNASTAAALHDPSCLLEHVGWVRELAQRLVRDPHAADDLTQETMLAAIENRGEPTRSPRAWLGRVLRNVMWERVRQNHRRVAREAQAVGKPPAASSAELVERVDTHRNVVDAVMRLPEHYRTVLLRRYFEGETPTQIAAALDMPISTVKTRLQRGIERMRAELDDSYGSRERWQPALIALVGVPRKVALVPALAAAATLMLATIGTLWAWNAWTNPAVPEAPDSTRGAVAANGSPDTRAPVERTTPPPSAGAQDETAIDWGTVKMSSLPIRGRVVTPDGQGVGGLLLRFDRDRHSSHPGSGTKIVISGPTGAFEMQADRTGRIVAVADDHATLCAGVVGMGRPQNLMVVVAPSRRLSGSVRNENGSLAHAEISLEEPDSMRATLGAQARSAMLVQYRAVTAADGRFAFTQLPHGNGMKLRIRREGYTEQIVPWHGEGTIDVTLKPLPTSATDATGFVLAPDGTPLADARVSCGTLVTRSNHSGAFRLPVPKVPEDRDSLSLLAVAPGYGAATIASTKLDRHRRPIWPKGVELTLAPTPLSIHGRVLRPDDTPCSGARVWLANPTLFAHEEGRTRRTTVRSVATDLSSHLWPQTVESLQSSGNILSPTITDAEGRFTIEGLCERTYRIIAYDYATSLRTDAVTVPAGAADAELRLSDQTIAKVRGVVVDQVGEPVAGVSVSLEATMLRVMWGPEQVFAQLHLRGAMRTGQDGSFWIFDVPRRGVTVRLQGAAIEPQTVPPTEEELRVVVHRTSLLCVTCADPDSVDSVGVIDQDGNPIAVLRRRGNSYYRSRRVPILDGQAEPFALPDNACAVIGYRKDTEARRTPVQPNLRTITW